MRKLLPLIVLTILLQSCGKDTAVFVESLPAAGYTHKVPMIWNQLYLEVERYCPGYKPPVSARNVAYINLIAYEAIVGGSRGKYNSFVGYFNGLDIERPLPGLAYDWEIVLHAAYERAFEMFYPTAPAEQQFRMLEVSSHLRSELERSVTADIYQRSSEYGKQVAESVYKWSESDTWGHEGYLHNIDPNYIAPEGLGLWKPTYPDYQPALLPQWGNVRTFAAKATDIAPLPPAFSIDPGSQLYQEAMQTRDLVNDIKSGARPEEYWIAEFWSDDCPILTFSPAGRWISIANQVVAIERLNLLETVVVYAKVSMALSDAGVKCWKDKYRYNCLRPIDYIRDYMHDDEWNTVMCPDGSGGFYTPNFPSYPSGHATFASAAAVVLEEIFGSDYNFTDRSHQGRTEFKGAPRSFSSFHEMALENAYSRVPLGVHFASDSEGGTSLGTQIGARVNDLPWTR